MTVVNANHFDNLLCLSIFDIGKCSWLLVLGSKCRNAIIWENTGSALTRTQSDAVWYLKGSSWNLTLMLQEVFMIHKKLRSI